MSTATESDIKELKDLLTALREDIKEIKNRLTTLENRFTALEMGQVEIRAKLSNVETSSQKIPDLAEKVGELKNWKQIGLTLGGALLGGAITYLLKNSTP